MACGTEIDLTDRTQPARWYMVDKDGMATLCTDREDAEQEAKDANMAWPHTAPHRAVQLVEVGTSAAELHPSPPDGMVGKWMPIETAPKGERVLLWSSVNRGEPFIGDWADYMLCNKPRLTHWSRWIPIPPTSTEVVGHG